MDQELDEELQYHLEQKIDEYVAQGLTPEQSRYAALRAMEGLAQRKEECRDARRLNGFEDTIRDPRYSLRVLAKSPGFTGVAVLTLALAVGANAVVFGILNGPILRPLNVPQAESLWGTEYGDGSGWQSFPTMSICAIATAASRTWQPLTSSSWGWTRATILPLPQVLRRAGITSTC